MRNWLLWKLALQLVVAILAVIPVFAGLAGVWSGPGFVKLENPWPADLDSHFRFLSGVFVAVGIGWFSCIPEIENKTNRFRFLATLTFAGGLARLLPLFLVGPPSIGHLSGLCIELVVVPLLVFWQSVIRRCNAQPTP